MIREIEFKDREEWLSIRAKYIGGSDAGAVIGLNPYKSAYSLWCEKTGKTEPFSGNIITKVGAYLEELVAKMFEEETGKKVRRKNFTMVNDLYPFACANVDRMVVGEKALLEIKTTNSVPLMKKLRNSDEFPEAYYAQVVHYLAVTGLEKAYLAVLINCRELKIYEMERDQAEIDALMKAEEDFWKFVVEDKPPQPDGSEASTEAISELYPESEDDTVDLFGYASFIEQYVELGKQIDELKAYREEAANKIKAYMKESAFGESRDYSVSWKSAERKTFDYKAFEADYANIDLQKYYKTTNTRTFRVKKKG